MWPHPQTMKKLTRASSARTQSSFQMGTATTEIVCKGRVLILRVYTHHFYTSSEEKRQSPPAKKAKKGSGAAQAKQSSAKGSRQKKSLSLLPAMPLDVLFEVKKVLSVAASHAHHLSNSSGFLASHSQGHHPPFPNKSSFPGYSHDEKCHLRVEGCKGAIRCARVPLEYERATVGRPSIWEPLSGSQKI